jgi:hypothetical protein
MIGIIALAIFLESCGLLCWASICHMPPPARYSPRSPEWPTVTPGDMAYGGLIVTGIVICLLGTFVCWY